MKYTEEQEEMLRHSPSHKPKKARITPSRKTAILIGVVAGIAAAYFIGPSILGKYKACKVKSISGG